MKVSHKILPLYVTVAPQAEAQYETKLLPLRVSEPSKRSEMKIKHRVLPLIVESGHDHGEGEDGHDHK